jgi:hypothetical protein
VRASSRAVGSPHRAVTLTRGRSRSASRPCAPGC